jgi:hypothetical protein
LMALATAAKSANLNFSQAEVSPRRSDFGEAEVTFSTLRGYTLRLSSCRGRGRLRRETSLSLLRGARGAEYLKFTQCHADPSVPDSAVRSVGAARPPGRRLPDCRRRSWCEYRSKIYKDRVWGRGRLPVRAFCIANLSPSRARCQCKTFLASSRHISCPVALSHRSLRDGLRHRTKRTWQTPHTFGIDTKSTDARLFVDFPCRLASG